MAERVDDASTARGSGHRNEVLLVGRLAAQPETRQLASGDVVVTWRVVVDRGPSAVTAPGRTVRIDTVDCAGWTGRVRRVVTAWRPGDLVEVSGSLRRRFWRTGATAVSRVQVEVTRARRVR